jgi:DNA repair protein SbcD/Mre11
MATPYLTFVHTADLHLGSPFEGLGPVAPRIAEALRQASFTALERIVDLCLAEGADALLVAGDVYDSADRSLHAQRRFRDALARAARGGVSSFVAHGNHDPLSGWQATLAFPPEVHRFGSDVEVVGLERDGRVVAHVAGSSYPVRDVFETRVPEYAHCLAGFESPFLVALLHAHVGGDPNHAAYAPTSVPELAAVTAVDYWALGHVHGFRRVAERPAVVYPGTPQGRSPRESGPRGVALVQIRAPRPRPEDVEVTFVPTSGVDWEKTSCDVSAASFDDLFVALERLRDEARRADRGVVLTIVLTGQGGLHGELTRLDFGRDLLLPLRAGEDERDDFVWVESIRDHTTPAADLVSARERDDLVGDFLRSAEELRGDSEGVREWLARRCDSPRVLAELRSWSPERLLGVLDAALVLGHDLLTTPGDRG